MSYTADQLISIISVVPKAIAVVDNNMKYVAASHRWVEDYGLQGKNLIGESHYDLFPEIGDAWKAIHSECLRGKAQTNPQDKFVRLDGTVQWLRWDVSPWLDPEGNILGMVMYSEDITAQIEEETQMKRVLDLYEETNEAARIGSWEHDLITGTIFWSPMVKHIYEVEEDFIPSLEKIRDFLKKDSDKAQMDSVVDEAVNERKSFDIDQEIITAKGKALWLRVRGNPQFKDSECIRISGTIQDIQELKLQSMLLKDSEEKYKSIIANSLTAHFLIHPDGRILEANKTALDMFGYTIDEMRTLGRADLLDTSDPNLAAYVKRREETGSAEAELTGIRKNGERFPHEISSVSFTDSNGIRRTSVSMVDITERKRAEENLRLSEAEFRAAFEYSALGMSLMDIDGRWIRINESFCRILGYTNRELMSRSLYELAHADDRDKDIPFVREVLSGSKKSYHLEKRYIHKNGTVVWVHQASSVVHDIDYKPSHWTVQIQDITEQKAVEDALREERELLRTLIDNIPTAVFIKDLESRKMLVNKAECDFMGVKDASEILGKNDFELFPIDFARITVAEDQEVFTTRKPIINREKVITWIDGRTRCLLTSKIPLFDNGKISGLLGITYDITQIKVAESALLESEKKYRRIFENIQDVFYQTDQEGIVTEISPSIEKHSGYSREEVIGKPATDFYYNLEDKEALVESIRANRMVSDFEVRLKTRSGERRYSSVNAQLIIQNGEIVGTEGSMRDVTDRKAQQDSLQALNNDLNTLNDQKNKLLSVIAHDLRNPIAGCVGLLEVVFMDIENTSKDELVEYMQMMQKGVLNAHELLEDLLEWARIQFHSVDFIPTRVDDLATEIRHTLKKLEPIAEAKQIQLKQEMAEGMSIDADKHMLASIIRNLVTNAIKFTNQHGQVVINVRREKGGYLFSVQDNGVGISKEDIAKLFSSDTGFSSYGTLGEKGTGMGLVLCRNFVEKHGGKIWIESTVGKGSTFYFNIPDQEKLH
ncbi:PAS domain S-box protein [Daejeonella sp. JGW-45]|uniref:PAS domain S-box protein n=1 Tax=Daejeonella sp. JGW-45 TaxID=3034148 RepID=UPI0023EC14C3|nr:PAS domain S-box protein [Daejeonella sp. JGW-45]